MFVSEQSFPASVESAIQRGRWDHVCQREDEDDGFIDELESEGCEEAEGNRGGIA